MRKIKRLRSKLRQHYAQNPEAKKLAQRKNLCLKNQIKTARTSLYFTTTGNY